MSPAVASGIVSEDASVSYWPIFSPSLVTVPEVFAWVNSAQFLLVSKVANVSLFLPVCCFHKWRSMGRWDRVCPWVPSYGRCGRTPITHLKLISTEMEVKQLPYSHGSSLRDVCYKSIPFCRVSVRLYMTLRWLFKLLILSGSSPF